MKEHLGAVVAVMKLSGDWQDFKAKLDRLYPRQDVPTQLSMDLAGDERIPAGACNERGRQLRRPP
jgi:hypothetical protein